MTNLNLGQLANLLAKNKNAVQAKADALLMEVHGLEGELETLEQSGTSGTQRAKDAITKKARILEDEIMRRIAELNQHQLSSLKEMKVETDDQFQSEQTRLKTAREALGGALGAQEAKMGNQLGVIEDSVGMTHKSLEGFEGTEQGAASMLGRGVAGVNRDLAMNEDKVDAALRNEDSSVADTMNNELGDVEGTVAALRRTQKGATGQINGMQEVFTDELGHLKQGLESGSKKLTAELQAVVGEDNDLVGEFGENTKTARGDLEASGSRLDKVVQKEMTQMEAFKKQLERISEGRTNDVGKLHAEVTQVKNELADTMGETINVVTEMRNMSFRAYASMDDQQRVFKRMLINASQLTSNHDSEDVSEMWDKQVTLERQHERLAQWMSEFKHYTLAWRDEVERKLKVLNGEIGGGESDIEQSRLQTENSMSNQMRSIKRGVEEEVVTAVGKEASKVGGLVNNINEDMGLVFNHAKASEESQNLAINEARNGLDIASEESGKEMGEIATAQSVLAAKAAGFKGAVNTAESDISQNLLLPQQSASESNRAYDNGMQQVEGRLAQFGSLLETNEKAGDAQHADVRALAAYRARLEKENAALAASCATLEGRFAHLESMLKGAGF